jgi:hypothetical protein
MSCFISEGVALGCSDGIGGIASIWVLGGSGSTISGITYNADGAITGVTGAGTLYQFQLKRNTSSLVQTVNKSYENGSIFFEQVLTAVMFKYDQDKRNLLKILSQNDNLKIVAVDQNGAQYLLGQENGMYLGSGDANSGTAFGDRNGYTLGFTGQEQEPANTIVGALGTVFSGITVVNY